MKPARICPPKETSSGPARRATTRRAAASRADSAQALVQKNQALPRSTCLHSLVSCYASHALLHALCWTVKRPQIARPFRLCTTRRRNLCSTFPPLPFSDERCCVACVGYGKYYSGSCCKEGYMQNLCPERGPCAYRPATLFQPWHHSPYLRKVVPIVRPAHHGRLASDRRFSSR